MAYFVENVLIAPEPITGIKFSFWTNPSLPAVVSVTSAAAILLTSERLSASRGVYWYLLSLTSDSLLR